MGRVLGTRGINEKYFKIMFIKPERKIPHGNPGRIFEDNIKMDIKKIRWEMESFAS
jgi:hypothetical protein